MEIDNYYIICPYCQNECAEPEDLYGIEDDDKTTFECEECGKRFWGERCVTVDYRTEADCELNNEKHEKGKHKCEKCDVYNPMIKEEEELKKEIKGENL